MQFAHSYLLALLSMASVLVNAQEINVALIKHKKCLLKGKWRLVETYALGHTNKVEKKDYDAVIEFKKFHRYREEVLYESNHWIIVGKWRVYRKSASLLLSKRIYVKGKMEAKPEDIHYNLFSLDKTQWAASGLAKNQEVKVYYKKEMP